MPVKKEVPEDQKQRDAVIRERARNIIVDAGAGTGKTTLLVDRLVELLAPAGNHPAIPVSRIAAVTFTRKAAGELRLKIREKILSGLVAEDQKSPRQKLLRDALAGLDTAYVGTIHSFADRLLRLRPVEANLSPNYEIEENEGYLISETSELILHGAQSGTLEQELAGIKWPLPASQVQEIILDALDAGILPETKSGSGYSEKRGLDALFKGFIDFRDIKTDLPTEKFDSARYRRYAEEFLALEKDIQGKGKGPGFDWFKRMADLIKSTLKEENPKEIFRKLILKPPEIADSTLGRGFGDCQEGFDAWKAFAGDKNVNKVRETALKDDLQGPLFQWLAGRLTWLSPVVAAAYEKVKARHKAVDQVDLLIKLRDILTGKEVRSYYQGLFDQILVDEFQDTDPLQAEVIAYLCEEKATGENWKEVKLASGKLTIVGDPKQSIYRFRRADIEMYEEMRVLIMKSDYLKAELTTNFRSDQALIEWFNGRFDEFLGDSIKEGVVFKKEGGSVFNRRLVAGREDRCPPSVHVLNYPTGGSNKGHIQAAEAKTLARYLRRLVDEGKTQVKDPVSGKPRPLAFGDIAVLAFATTGLAPLFKEFDLFGIPYSSRGGQLFINDALHTRFILALRAIADKDDGLALAMLLRPPFFSVDLDELALIENGEKKGDGLEAARQAQNFIRELRARRHQRLPGETARELLESTVLGRAVALGPNGAQRLDRLRELCHIIANKACNEGWDFDEITAETRGWMKGAPQLDPPHPVGKEAVQVMTVFQAKGLEFPAVAIWDSSTPASKGASPKPWIATRDGKSWAITIANLAWEETEEGSIFEKEDNFLTQERKRLVYVQATRARDLLIIPKHIIPEPKKGSKKKKPDCIYFDLLGDLEKKSDLVQIIPGFSEENPPAWAKGIEGPAQPKIVFNDKLFSSVNKRWDEELKKSSRPFYQPISVVAAAVESARYPREVDGLTDTPRKPREGRFGTVFGDTVHLGIGRVISGKAKDASGALDWVRKETGLAENISEAQKDIERALNCLKKEGLLEKDIEVQLEYPVAGPQKEEKIISGFMDFIGIKGDCANIIDFKTDSPPEGGPQNLQSQYREQVKKYREILGQGSLSGIKNIKCGILFTASGKLFWVE
jgi:ATP-dependent helicase/nuclease subunit A